MASDNRRIHVVAGAIRDRDDRVLLALRHDHLHQGGLWEFPGGKLEAGETARQALEREIREELDLTVDDCRPLISVLHDYPDKSVLLDVWLVDSWHGTPTGLQGQPLDWVSVPELVGREFPAANLPVLRALQLPADYLITPEPSATFLRHLEASLKQGVRLVLLRTPGLDDESYAELARDCIKLVRLYDARLMLNRSPEMVIELGADGLHINSRRLGGTSSIALPKDKWLAASCHDAHELQLARDIGADFVMLSPVKRTASHPDTEPLGWQRFEELASRCSMPVYALGGMVPADREQAWLSGAQGIAAIRGLWADDGLEG